MAIIGTNIILYYFNGSSNIAFGASKNCSFETSTDLFEITSSYNAWFTSSLPNLSSWTINCDGFVANGQFEFKQMLDFQLARTPISIRFSIGTSPTYIISGTANITAIGASGQYDSAVTYKVTLQGSGRYTIS
jgi:predicted secreted protein